MSQDDGEHNDNPSSEGAASAAPDPMDPERWYSEPNVCGSCIAWRPEIPAREGDKVATGQCKLRPELGRVPASLKLCKLYKARGQYVYTPSRDPGPKKRKRAGEVKVLRRTEDGQMVSSSVPAPGARRERPEPPPRPPPPREINLGEDESLPVFKAALVELIREEHGDTGREMLRRFKGGVVQLKGAGGRVKEVPIARFFSMLDRFKSSLAELEGAIEAQESAKDVREDLLANARRIRGSFTTFNVLYADRDDYFTGKD